MNHIFLRYKKSKKDRKNAPATSSANLCLTFLLNFSFKKSMQKVPLINPAVVVHDTSGQAAFLCNFLFPPSKSDSARG